MLKNTVIADETPAARTVTSETLAQLKKQDMEQALGERWKVKIQSSARRTAARHGERSPDWRPVDDEC